MPAPPPSPPEARPADQAAGFAAAWLRANCPCARCQDPGSGQRLASLTDLPAQVRVAAVGGTRHLQGCYADLDGVSSTVSVLRRRTS